MTPHQLEIKWVSRAEVPVKMSPRRNRPLTEAYEQEFEQCVMARMEERLDQFVDQLADQMNDMMNPRRRRDRNRQGSEDRPRRNHREDNRRWESGMSVNILEFDGDTLNPEGFIDWLVAVEEVFEFKEVPENKRVSLIATKLRGRASDCSSLGLRKKYRLSLKNDMPPRDKQATFETFLKWITKVYSSLGLMRCLSFLAQRLGWKERQLLLDEEALRETLEEEARQEKELEERMRQEQARDELFRSEFGVISDSESDNLALTPSPGLVKRYCKDLGDWSKGCRCVGKADISALVKCTSAIRQSAYRCVPVLLEGIFQIGSNNDVNVLRQSLVLNDLKVGKALEVPFVANDVTYKWGYYLTDGIYPEWVVLMEVYCSRRIHQLDTTYPTFLSGQRIEFDCLNGVSVSQQYGVFRKLYTAWCMTRSSTKELLSPLENPERVLRSKRKLFDNPSLVEASSLESKQLFEIEEHVEEEVTEKMAETMEEYMSKTRENYGSGITRPTINQDTPFELKGQFLKELRDNTFSGSEHEDANEHIEKVLEIVDLFHIPKEILKTKFLNKYCPPARTAKKMEEINNFQQEPDESLFRAWERFKELMMKCPQHYLTDMQEVILFYNGLDVLSRQILDSKGVIPSKTAADAKIAIQEMAEYSQKWHNGTSSKTKGTETSDGLAAIQAQLNNLGREIKKKEEGKLLEEAYYTQFGTTYQPRGQYRAAGPGFYQRNNGNSSYPARRDTMEESLAKFMTESAKRHEENSNIIKEIRASTDAVIHNQGASIKSLELQIGQMSTVLQERGFGSLPSSTETNPKDQVKSISTATANLSSICRMKHYPYAVSVPQHRFCFPETVPFPRRLCNHCCDDFKEAHGAYIPDTCDRTMPPKEKDPGSFTLPCLINNICFNKALVDLGANVSVMPLSTYTNLCLGELSHTRMTIKLADRTIKQPRGIASNVLLRIGKFIFPIDFFVLDIPEDGDIPLILGRPFLSTAHVKIDVHKRKVTLRVGEEKLVFQNVKPASGIITKVFME
ncbi:retrovirus-related pol polyprotein from transposon TNT 1-94 [Tanacetum coccineum]|uniref:Retrovirus-related pol polyprotein from transposon TNT 1-94 n=1 Tax=Tanacetum coccineum TaxID=301880 RepID=A0ABQ5BSM2_9ASTR